MSTGRRSVQRKRQNHDPHYLPHCIRADPGTWQPKTNSTRRTRVRGSSSSCSIELIPRTNFAIVFGTLTTTFLPTDWSSTSVRSARQRAAVAFATIPRGAPTCIMSALWCYGAFHATLASQKNRMEHYRSETAADPCREGERGADRPETEAYGSGRTLQSAYEPNQPGTETFPLSRSGALGDTTVP
jgi:hypothetical protein